MHRRRVLSRPLLLACLVLLPVGLAVSACGPGAVRATPFEQSDSVACAAVARLWPETVGQLPGRVTAVQTAGVAAWGDPPIVARCGKAPIGPTEDPCIDVNGVDWVATTLDDGTMFTTYGREPAVEVLVPDAYDSAPMWLPAFGPAVEQIPQTLGECSSVLD